MQDVSSNEIMIDYVMASQHEWDARQDIRILMKSLVHRARHVARAPIWHFYMAIRSRDF